MNELIKMKVEMKMRKNEKSEFLKRNKNFIILFKERKTNKWLPSEKNRTNYLKNILKDLEP